MSTSLENNATKVDFEWRVKGIVLISLAMALLTPALPLLVRAQSRTSAQAAYDDVQKQRKEAEKLWAKQGASKEDIEQGIEILKKALVYLDDPLVAELARGNLYLKARRADALRDLAKASSLMGKKVEAIDYLRQRFAENPSGYIVTEMREGKVFEDIRQEPGFKELLAKFDAAARLRDNTALKTSYREDLTEDEKVAGLSFFWSEVKYNFANFDLAPVALDWNKLYLDYLPKVRATRSTLEYYRVLQEMCARLHDAHTLVLPPKELEAEVFSHPPVRTALIEDKVLVTEVWSESLLKSGLRPGLEVVSIDGLPVRQYADERVAPYQSSSTPQDLTVRAYTYALFAGPKDRPFELELRDSEGVTTKMIVSRAGYTDVKTPPPFDFKILTGNLAYVALNAFEDKEIVKSFDSIFDQISRADALILDVRKNGGGSGAIGYAILKYLTDKPFKASRWKTPDYRSAYRAWGFSEPGWDGEPVDEVKPKGDKVFTKPVVVLTSARTFSAAEDFVVAFDYMKRGAIIGELTGGSTGQPLEIQLPGGLTAHICTKRDSYPDGKEFVGIGVQPQVAVRRTVIGMRAGMDEVLEAALDYLKHSRAASQR